MRLSVKANALSFGILFAIAVLIGTFLSMTFGTGMTLGALSIVMPGYAPTQLFGAIIGAIWGMVYGAIAGGLQAMFYNAFAGSGSGA